VQQNARNRSQFAPFRPRTNTLRDSKWFARPGQLRPGTGLGAGFSFSLVV